MSIRWSQQQYNLYLEYTHLQCIYLHTQAFLRNQSSYEIKCVLKTKIQEIFLDSQFPSFPLLTIIMLSTSFKSENIRILGLKLSQSRSCGHSDGLSPMPVTFTCATAPTPGSPPLVSRKVAQYIVHWSRLAWRVGFTGVLLGVRRVVSGAFIQLFLGECQWVRLRFF